MVNQSTIVFFFLLAAFVVFVTQRGELPAYLALLFGGGTAPAQGATGAATSGSASTATNALAQAIPTIATAAATF